MSSKPPKFPLPLGHMYGPSRLHLTHHDGRSRTDSVGLRVWQQAYRSRWNRPRALDATGRFDGGTQKAVLEVQRHAGLTPTGLLDIHTWRALWDRDPPPPRPKRQAKLEKQHRSKQPGYERDLRKRRAYWESFSRFRVGSDPDAPAWWPGRPFGPHERGPHVEHVQRLLGFAPTGKMQVSASQRLRGLQRAHGLVESGLVDGPTARLLDSLEGAG